MSRHSRLLPFPRVLTPTPSRLALLAAGDRVDASLAGFSLTFALQISYNILFLVRRYTALELGMGASSQLGLE